MLRQTNLQGLVACFCILLLSTAHASVCNRVSNIVNFKKNQIIDPKGIVN